MKTGQIEVNNSNKKQSEIKTPTNQQPKNTNNTTRSNNSTRGSGRDNVTPQSQSQPNNPQGANSQAHNPVNNSIRGGGISRGSNSTRSPQGGTGRGTGVSSTEIKRSGSLPTTPNGKNVMQSVSSNSSTPEKKPGFNVFDTSTW